MSIRDPSKKSVRRFHAFTRHYTANDLEHSDQFTLAINLTPSSMAFLSLSQDGASCGGHSSSGSTSSLSTPPSVSQSPPQLNGVAAAATGPGRLGGVAGLIGALGAGSALGMAGIVGALNGVIQTPPGTTGAAAGATLPVNNGYVRRWLPLQNIDLINKNS